VDKKGAWLQFEGELIGQGKEAAQKAMVENQRWPKKLSRRLWRNVTPRPLPSKAEENFSGGKPAEWRAITLMALGMMRLYNRSPSMNHEHS